MAACSPSAVVRARDVGTICGLGCRADEDCSDPLYPVCDLESGDCRCNEVKLWNQRDRFRLR